MASHDFLSYLHTPLAEFRPERAIEMLKRPSEKADKIPADDSTTLLSMLSQKLEEAHFQSTLGETAALNLKKVCVSLHNCTKKSKGIIEQLFSRATSDKDFQRATQALDAKIIDQKIEKLLLLAKTGQISDLIKMLSLTLPILPKESLQIVFSALSHSHHIMTHFLEEVDPFINDLLRFAFVNGKIYALLGRCDLEAYPEVKKKVVLLIQEEMKKNLVPVSSFLKKLRQTPYALKIPCDPMRNAASCNPETKKILDDAIIEMATQLLDRGVGDAIKRGFDTPLGLDEITMKLRASLPIPSDKEVARYLSKIEDLRDERDAIANHSDSLGYKIDARMVEESRHQLDNLDEALRKSGKNPYIFSLVKQFVQNERKIEAAILGSLYRLLGEELRWMRISFGSETALMNLTTTQVITSQSLNKASYLLSKPTLKSVEELSMIIQDLREELITPRALWRMLQEPYFTGDRKLYFEHLLVACATKEDLLRLQEMMREHLVKEVREVDTDSETFKLFLLTKKPQSQDSLIEH